MLLCWILCIVTLPAFAEEVVTGPSAAVTIDLTGIAQAVIALLAALITTKLIPWIKARTTAQQQSLLDAVVDTLVFAAEQIYGSGTGKEKLEYVQSQLTARGYTIDLNAIEATVKRLNQTQTSIDPDNPD